MPEYKCEECGRRLGYFSMLAHKCRRRARPQIMAGDFIHYEATGRVQSVRDGIIRTESEDAEEVSRANVVSVERGGVVIWVKR